MESDGYFRPWAPSAGGTGSGGGSGGTGSGTVGGTGGTSTGAPVVTLTASSTSPSHSLTVGQAVTYSATFSNSGGTLTNGQLGFRIVDSNGNQVDATTSSNQSIVTGGTQTLTYASTAPATVGTYSVIAAAWDASWNNYVYTQVDTLTVSASGGGSTGNPAITVTTSSTSPSNNLNTGDAVTYTATFTNNGAALSNGQLGFRITDSNGNQVDSYTLTGVNLAGGGASTQITYSSNAPATAGTYTVTAAAWDSTYANTYLYTTIDTLTVGGATAAIAPAVTPLAGTYAAAQTVSPSTSVTHANPVKYAITFQNSGAAISNGILGIRIENSSAQIVDQYTLYNVNLAPGATLSTVYTSKAPTSTGKYNLIGGVWSTNFGTTYSYKTAQSFTVK